MSQESMPWRPFQGTVSDRSIEISAVSSSHQALSIVNKDPLVWTIERTQSCEEDPTATDPFLYLFIPYFWSGEEIERPETQHVVDVDFVASFASEIDKRASDLASILRPSIRPRRN